MIKIDTHKLEIEYDFEEVIKTRMIDCTCKTNLNPQFIFQQSYTGITKKTFIGGWTETGFWISKFRHQFMQFRPAIIGKFYFEDKRPNKKLIIRYSIGFSSIAMGLLLIFIFSLIFASFGMTVYLIGLLFLIIVYIILSKMELVSLKKTIKKELFFDESSLSEEQ